MKYGYFAASLPSLAFGEPVPMEMEGFVAECRRQLETVDADEVAALASGAPAPTETPSAFFREWRQGMIQLRNAIVRARAPRQPSPVDEKKYLRDHEGYRVWLEDGVQDAFSRATPLEREQALDRLRWAFADELSRSAPFDLPAILAYTVKLAIGLRWQAMTPEQGEQNLDELLNAVMTTSDEVKGWMALASM